MEEKILKPCSLEGEKDGRAANKNPFPGLTCRDPSPIGPRIQILNSPMSEFTDEDRAHRIQSALKLMRHSGDILDVKRNTWSAAGRENRAPKTVWVWVHSFTHTEPHTCLRRTPKPSCSLSSMVSSRAAGTELAKAGFWPWRRQLTGTGCRGAGTCLGHTQTVRKDQKCVQVAVDM